MSAVRIWGAMVLAGLMLISSGCSDGSSEIQRIEKRLEQLSTELRQQRGEMQRSNERVIALVQAQAAQGGLGLSGPSAGASLTVPTGATTNMEASKALAKANEVMSAAMSAVPLTGDPDRDFLAQMIPHHQGAIDMSKVLLKDGLRPEVRRFAQEIIAHQQAEIELMNRWLAAIGK